MATRNNKNSEFMGGRALLASSLCRAVSARKNTSKKTRAGISRYVFVASLAGHGASFVLAQALGGRHMAM